MIRVSVIVIGYAPADLLSRCLAMVRAQARDRSDVEVLVVAHPTHQGTSLTPVKAECPDVMWIDASPSHNVARMRGLGIARSRGAVVALLEGDCMPAPDWLTHLTQMNPASGVGGAVEPGNFRHGVDWAAYFCEFAKYMLPLPPAPAQLPGANVVYRRAALPDPAQLEREGFYETFVNASIGGDAPLATDGKLIVQHERTWKAGVAMATRFHHGRGFAALRLKDKPVKDRLPYIPLAMLLPFVLVMRVMGEMTRRRRLVGRAMLTLPWIVALSFSWAFGEFMGYIAGPGTSLDRWR